MGLLSFGSYRNFQLYKGYLKWKIWLSWKFLCHYSNLARKVFINENYACCNSKYCYNVWMKHFKFWSKLNKNVPDIVVEIGSGNSLGVGLAALLSGASKFYALEKTQFWTNSTNLRVFDELVELFKQRQVTKEYSVDAEEGQDQSMSFPNHILSDDYLDKCLTKDRLSQIREELKHSHNPNNKYIRTIIPWSNEDVEPNSVDLICSHTVLQYVKELDFTYKMMNHWLKKDGCISHFIDFTSSNTSKLWNGHWTYDLKTWKLVTGGSCLINRKPLSTHLRLLENNNFKIKYKVPILSANTLSVEDLSDDFKHLDHKDLTTRGYYYFARAE